MVQAALGPGDMYELMKSSVLGSTRETLGRKSYINSVHFPRPLLTQEEDRGPPLYDGVKGLHLPPDFVGWVVRIPGPPP